MTSYYNNPLLAHNTLTFACGYLAKDIDQCRDSAAYLKNKTGKVPAQHLEALRKAQRELESLITDIEESCHVIA